MAYDYGKHGRERGEYAAIRRRHILACDKLMNQRRKHVSHNDPYLYVLPCFMFAAADTSGKGPDNLFYYYYY